MNKKVFKPNKYFDDAFSTLCREKSKKGTMFKSKNETLGDVYERKEGKNKLNV